MNPIFLLLSKFVRCRDQQKDIINTCLKKDFDYIKDIDKNIDLLHLFKKHNDLSNTKNYLQILESKIMSKSKCTGLTLNLSETHELISIEKNIVKMYAIMLKNTLQFVKLKSIFGQNIEVIIIKIYLLRNKTDQKKCLKMLKKDRFLLLLIKEQLFLIRYLKKIINSSKESTKQEKTLKIKNDDKIFRSISNSIILLIIADEITDKIFCLYTQAALEVQSSLNDLEITLFIGNNTYFYNFFERIRQNMFYKFQDLRNNVYFIEANLEKKNDDLNLNVINFLLNHKVLKRFSNYLQIECVGIYNKLESDYHYSDNKYQFSVNKINALLNNETLYDEILSLLDVEVFDERFKELISLYCESCNNTIQKYKEELKNKIQYIYDEIYTNAIFFDSERKTQLHLEVFDSRIEIFFDDFIYIDSLIELYEDLIIKKKYIPQFKHGNLKAFFSKLFLCESLIYEEYYNFKSLKDNFLTSLIYYGIVIQNDDENKFLIFSNFDLWLNNIFNMNINELINYIKSGLNSDCNKILKEYFPDISDKKLDLE